MCQLSVPPWTAFGHPRWVPLMAHQAPGPGQSVPHTLCLRTSWGQTDPGASPLGHSSASRALRFVNTVGPAPGGLSARGDTLSEAQCSASAVVRTILSQAGAGRQAGGRDGQTRRPRPRGTAHPQSASPSGTPFWVCTFVNQFQARVLTVPYPLFSFPIVFAFKKARTRLSRLPCFMGGYIGLPCMEAIHTFFSNERASSTNGPPTEGKVLIVQTVC